MDTVAGYLTYKLANKFGLRTAHGNMDFTLLHPVPGINVGDMIVLVIASENGAILSINDLTTGVWRSERPIPPFRVETVGIGSLIFLCVCVAMLAPFGYAFGLAHIPASIALSVFATILVFGFMDSWRRAKNHNIKLMDKVQAVATNASADPKIWDIPERGPSNLPGDEWRKSR
jgi:hypothetical protein